MGRVWVLFSGGRVWLVGRPPVLLGVCASVCLHARKVGRNPWMRHQGLRPLGLLAPYPQVVRPEKPTPTTFETEVGQEP